MAAGIHGAPASRPHRPCAPAQDPTCHTSTQAAGASARRFCGNSDVRSAIAETELNTEISRTVLRPGSTDVYRQKYGSDKIK